MTAQGEFQEQMRMFDALVGQRGASLPPASQEMVRRAVVGLQKLLVIADGGELSEEQVFEIGGRLMGHVIAKLLEDTPAGRA